MTKRNNLTSGRHEQGISLGHWGQFFQLATGHGWPLEASSEVSLGAKVGQKHGVVRLFSAVGPRGFAVAADARGSGLASVESLRLVLYVQVVPVACVCARILSLDVVGTAAGRTSRLDWPSVRRSLRLASDPCPPTFIGSPSARVIQCPRRAKACRAARTAFVGTPARALISWRCDILPPDTQGSRH